MDREKEKENGWMSMEVSIKVLDYYYSIKYQNKGCWKNDKKEGTGEKIWGDGEFRGDTYIGYLIKINVLNIIFKLINKNINQGQWNNDKIHGLGEYRWANGDIYKGIILI